VVVVEVLRGDRLCESAKNAETSLNVMHLNRLENFRRRFAGDLNSNEERTRNTETPKLQERKTRRKALKDRVIVYESKKFNIYHQKRFNEIGNTGISGPDSGGRRKDDQKNEKIRRRLRRRL
jgi:hypothetical protein